MASPSPIHLSDCWAKTDPVTELPVLSVPDHCAIVGQVAVVLSEFLPAPLAKLFPEGWPALIAAHDIGKITPGFLLKCELWIHAAAVSRSIHGDGLETDHSKVGASYLIRHLPRQARGWLLSTAGHHGAYPYFKVSAKPSFEGASTEDGMHPDFERLRDELLNHLIRTFGPLPQEPAAGRKADIHLLTGFTIFADWIGSNADWFSPGHPFDTPSISLKTRNIARTLGLSPQLRPSLSFNELFKEQIPAHSAPRPLQTALLEAGHSPGLYIVEAPMGTGKTEAALALAYQRWSTGEERGLYFALPTQLTSEKIHERVHAFLQQILDGPSYQSLIHGNAWLSDDRNRPVGPADPEYNDTDEALRWFSSTRRQLLSPFGIGTIDQALLSILPARFAALRFFGLAGKVVILDEVHSYDAYMSALIDRLIRYLLPTGSTVIILSATLTAKRRAELVAAAGAAETSSSRDYPLITAIPTGSATATHFPLPPGQTQRPVHLSHHTLHPGNQEIYWRQIAAKIEAGANVVVIRNTVALAQETYRTLSALLTDRIPAEHKALVHSRFPHWLRIQREGDWIDRLGKNSSRRPQGSLLVATQIVEQSVDIDADLLITDLAPVELILQRIGRLHRHSHPRPSGCEIPSCHILHPPVDWTADENEIKKSLSPHRFVYPALALWQAAETLESRETLNLPGEIRSILETAAELQPPPHQPALREFLRQAEEEIQEHIATAKSRDIFSASAIDDKEGMETRYRIPLTAKLILLRSYSPAGQIAPLHGSPLPIPSENFSPPLARTLHENAISIPAYLVQDELRRTGEERDWLHRHIPDGVLTLIREDSDELELLDSRNPAYRFFYTSGQGLRWEKSGTSVHTPAEEEDFWF